MQGGTRSSSDGFAAAGRIYREAAGYVASFLAQLDQRCQGDGEALVVELVGCELSEHDRRVLR